MKLLRCLFLLKKLWLNAFAAIWNGHVNGT